MDGGGTFCRPVGGDLGQAILYLGAFGMEKIRCGLAGSTLFGVDEVGSIYLS